MLGRRSKLHDAADKFLSEIEKGRTIAAAAAESGFCERTVHYWLAQGREEKSGKYFQFLQSYTRARGKAQGRLIQVIQDAAPSD